MASHACSGFNMPAAMKPLLCSRLLSFAWRAVSQAAAFAALAHTSHELCTISCIASRADGAMPLGQYRQARLALFQAMQVTRVDKVSEGGRGHCHSHSRVRRGSLPVKAIPACSPMSLLPYSSCWPGPTPSFPSASGVGLVSSVPWSFAAAGSAVTACISTSTCCQPACFAMRHADMEACAHNLLQARFAAGALLTHLSDQSTCFHC